MSASLPVAGESQQAKKRAVLLVNLGTPETAEPKSVRKFLAEFLSDRRVVEIPRLIWWPILHGIILTTRPKAVAKAYQSIWWEEGSPLRVITERQRNALQKTLSKRFPNEHVTVEYAMSYGDPGIAQQIKDLQAQGVDHIAVLPLYPQYSATTTAVVYDQLAELQQQQRDIADARVCKYYFDRPSYIKALAHSVREYRLEHGSAERLLMSFHGIPKRCVDLGDPYYQHCVATAEALAGELGLEKEQWGISFQSRLGKAEWLKPYTSDIVQEWGREKLSSLDVICPAFAADCLETLEEISEEIREEFQEAGGGDFSYIPCLNDSAMHIECLAELSEELLGL
ncbi:ferrochelatase [Pseudoteredinibacter isoporae]|uniref:Ferrochelatase n=1 Tax=Pseudoteredinibacter isoporae TaxID=570281 RepID=A0A7X0JWV2_9GAMM|nr:ferrochelatase [Pseudoteredinibacter isoporae]MBB6523723.1 ferrochelatase [Pseudoteredinibacter isoporae]NHO89226.1 ferrochelatase [Pseudoteredinibacter isoporae]NIB22163.1 ferrochelatase [Pseudoteredinibacter isoporae]